MKELRQHILEKLKVSTSGINNIFDDIHHRTKRMSYSSFQSILKEYGKPFELNRIYGSDLPILDSPIYSVEFNCPVERVWYYEPNRTINFEYYDPNQKKLISSSIGNMDTILETLGKGDIDKGNDVLWEIHDMILNT